MRPPLSGAARLAAAILVAAAFGLWVPGQGATAGVGALCASAAAPHHATVVVTHLSSQPMRRVCVAFNEEHISGSELLDRSGIPWASDAYQGQGTAVCQVDHEPTSPPTNGCLGHGSDPYWSVWTASYGGSWTYAQKAITALVIHDGDAEGFRYQQPDGAGPPGPIGTSCPPPTSPATPVAAPASASPVTPEAGAGGGNPTPARGSASAGGATKAAGPLAVVPGETTPSPALTADGAEALRDAPSAAPPGAPSAAPLAAVPGRPQAWLGLAAAGLAGVILVGAALAQVMLRRPG